MNKPRCGVDLIEIDRFARFFDKATSAQLEAIFTHDETTYCSNKEKPLQSLAARFAVKEACIKLFPKEASSKEVDFIDVEVIVDNYGAPSIKMTPKLKEIMQRYQVSSLSTSISHTEQSAIAMVVAA